MALHIAFEKSADSFIKKLVKILAGPYVHTEIIISKPNEPHVAYSAYMSCCFSKTPQRDFCFGDSTHDFLSIPVSSEELDRISKSCEACVRSKIPYNTHDMVFCQVPLRNPTENDLFNSPALFCSQAVVLILRACLDIDHDLHPHLSTVNSRTVSPSHLFDVLKTVCASSSAQQALCHRSAHGATPPFALAAACTPLSHDPPSRSPLESP